MIDVAMGQLRRFRTAISLLVLALLAYVPALTAAPGRMPADSKLYIYLNPTRFLADATTTFDPRQFAGWVPHQHIAYLWPTGPWFWVFETLGIPDWVAHRLWIGTLLVLAGLGVRYVARLLGANALAALVAALVYQLSPYVLPYISRTSVLLLPWAGLGWIVAFTVLATRRPGWRYPAAIALVVLTVGAVNATALAMVIPAPALWLLHAAWGRSITWRRAFTAAARTGLLCTGVSLWWIVMLVIQGRQGADVLAYSESLESVSFTSTSTEVTRGLGYWLFYVRDAYAATTTASIDHLVSIRTIVFSWFVMLVGFVGIAVCRWPHRRYAALLVGAGVILGVGVHPIDDPSPLMSLLVGDGEGGVALALRSSTRAVPVLLLGVALGAAQVVTSVRLPASGIMSATRRRRHVADTDRQAGIRVATATVIGLVAVLALPALRNGGFVDEALERDEQPPQAWLDAAIDLDGRPDGFRVLQVPGTEFGAFQWGYTVDQPLPALTRRPLITRDLLPLGSPAAMDLVFALDDRFQTDTIEPDAVETVARLMGVDTIWITGDVAYDRFRLARPEVVIDELSGLEMTTFGAATVMDSQIPMVDNRSLGDPRVGRPIAPVVLADVSDPIPTARVKDTLVVLTGSGDGIIDAAAAGVIDGTEAIVYADTVFADRDFELPATYRFVITDSNRDRAHHWRTSQDVTGFTESAADASDVLRFESGDQRLPVFPNPNSDRQSVSIQDGAVRATASGYGERFAYLPEHRPVMAIDGDPSTAWIVADRAPAIGEFIRLDVDEPIDHLDLLQPPAEEGERTITEVTVQVNDRPPAVHTLDERSRTGAGQRIEANTRRFNSTDADAGAIGLEGTVTITVTGTSEPQPPIGDAIRGVGFVEIGTGLDPTVELIRTPIDAPALVENAAGVDVVLTRLRHEPTDRWRSDPEPRLARQFAIPQAITVDAAVTVRLDRRLDDAALAALLDEPVVASAHLTGAPNHRGAAAFDGTETTAWITPFDDVVGQTVSLRGSGVANELTVVQRDSENFSPITAVRVTDAAGPLDISLSPGAETVVDLPRQIDLASVTFEVTAIEPRLTQNRRFNEQTVLPAALSEVLFDGRSPLVTPTERVSADCRDDLLMLDGEPVALSFDANSSEALSGAPIMATVCGGRLALPSGTRRVISTPGSATGFDVDRVTLSTSPASEPGVLDPARPVVVEASTRSRTIEVPPCPSGCWVVHGEGYNDGWSATADDADLGAPRLIDGNANGWWLPASDAPTTVTIRWPAQRRLNIAFLLTAISLVACIALVLRRRPADSGTDPKIFAEAVPSDRSFDSAIAGAGPDSPWILALASSATGALLIDWAWAIPVALIWTAAIALGRTAIVAWAGVAALGSSALIVTEVVRVDRPIADAAWPIRFEWLHEWTLLGVLLLVTGSLFDQHARRRPPMSSAQAGGS